MQVVAPPFPFHPILRRSSPPSWGIIPHAATSGASRCGVVLPPPPPDMLFVSFSTSLSLCAFVHLCHCVRFLSGVAFLPFLLSPLCVLPGPGLFLFLLLFHAPEVTRHQTVLLQSLEARRSRSRSVGPEKKNYFTTFHGTPSSGGGHRPSQLGERLPGVRVGRTNSL